MNKSDRKIFVVDTSVLLYDKDSIHAFKGNCVYLSMQVLDELDKFKGKKGYIGECARYVNRYLDSLRRPEEMCLSKGIIDDQYDIEYRVVLLKKKTIEEAQENWSLDTEIPDNKIILTAVQVKKEEPYRKVVLVTKDINLRVKCDSLGLEAEDYYRDYLTDAKFDQVDSVWSGKVEVQTDPATINEWFASDCRTIQLTAEMKEQVYPNCLAIFKSDLYHTSCIAVVSSCKNTARIIKNVQSKISGIIPQDKEQCYALMALTDPSIPLVTITGAPGSGKTFLSLLNGIEKVNSGEFERIVLTRSIQPVGREMGFLPGDINDKMAPWLGPFIDNVRHAYKDLTYFDMMRQKGKIDIAPLSYIRGRTFPNSYIIVDEAQNATIHELKTVITRVGNDSKIILIGDIDQIDTPYINRLSNGLSVVIDKFKDSSQSAHIHLNRGRRSAIANEANKLL